MVEAPSPAPALVPLKGMRGSIARNMAAAWQAPRVAQTVEVDMTQCFALQARMHGEGTRVTVTPIVLRGIALALRAHPQLNALLRQDGIERSAEVHLGVAVALDEGLAVPVIRDAHELSIAQLAQAARELASASREGRLAPRHFQGGTFTVTNLGATGIDWFTPILNAPQVAILGMGATRERAVVRNGALAIAPVMTLTLVFDHRALDGDPAARFLADLRRRLESCEDL